MEALKLFGTFLWKMLKLMAYAFLLLFYAACRLFAVMLEATGGLIKAILNTRVLP